MDSWIFNSGVFMFSFVTKIWRKNEANKQREKKSKGKKQGKKARKKQAKCDRGNTGDK